MNSIPKIILLVSLVLLMNACAHHPRYYSNYPDSGSYGSGYTVAQRNYYGGTSGHYDNGYGWGKGNFPHHHHEQYNAPSRWNGDYLRPRYQHDGRDNHGYRPHDNRSDNNWVGHNFNHRVDSENNRHHEQYNASPRWNGDYLGPRYQHDGRDNHGYRPHDNRSDNNWSSHNFNHSADNGNNHQNGTHDSGNRHRKDHHQRFNE